MLLIVRCEQLALVDALGRDAGRGAVGPTSAEGWTAAWLETEPAALLAATRPYLAVTRRPGGVLVRVATDEGTSQCVIGDGLPVARDLDDVAGAVGRLFDAPHRTGDVRKVLETSARIEDLADGLAGTIAGCPEIRPAVPRRSVVAHRGDPLAARMAAALEGPSFLTAIDATWSVLSDATDPSHYVGLGARAGAASSGSRGVVLALWRGTTRASGSTSSGVTLFRGDQPVGATSWNSGWRYLRPPDPAPADDLAGLLSEQVTRGRADMVALRTIMRASEWASDPLAELVTLLDLPNRILTVLDAGGRDAGGAAGAGATDGAAVLSAELVPRLSSVRATMAAVRDGQRVPPRSPRWLRAVWAAGTVAAAMVCLLMTVTGIAVIWTDGAVADTASTTAGDWLFSAVFAVLTAVLVPTAVRRIRRARR
ncbi:hypothetical protein [Parafrankia sp. EUN1f]|uniref:hypothetical protein n=1 Tax=Parafrankia sp. EUN1f TaxID=102897 RepID=UPI000560B746|nr:hypothetical protein [Parafrankia sp. EUN1f]